MALNPSGPISLAGSTAGESIALELGLSATAQIALNDTAVRDLAGVSSGAIVMPTDFWGKSAGGWDITTLNYTAQGYAGNISTALFVAPYSVAGQDLNPEGVFFKPDGTKMYVLGNSNNAVYEYSLNIPWWVNSTNITYVQSFSVGGNPTDLYFRPDGTNMYVIDSNADAVTEYSLSTAWNISTASNVRSFSVSAQETNPEGLFFKPDGTKMYICGTSGDDVNEYSLSTAWNVSTASYVQNFSVAAQDTTPQSLSFTSDGTKMYVIGNTGDDLNEYSLSTAWNISTASYVQNLSAGETTPTGVYISGNGAFLYMTGQTNDSVDGYVLGGFQITQDSNPQDVFFKPDGTKMYIVGSTGDSVYEYSLSTAWELSTVSYVQAFSVSVQEASPTGLFFKPDGTKMYVCGFTGDDINEYSLSTAWDISTASYVQVFSISAQEGTIQSLFFKPDGTKMYIVGSATDTVYEYSLSTAWNISTASYVQGFSVAAQEGGPSGVFFKSDGTKMYISWVAGNQITEYSLSTAWNISTASFTANKSTLPTDSPRGLFIRDDGLLLFTVNLGDDRVCAFTME